MVDPNWINSTLIIFSLLLIFKFFIHKQKRYTNLPPGPPSLPIIGHLHLIKEPLHETFQALSQKYGPVIQLHFGVRRVIVVSSPSAVEECFTKNDIVLANRPRLTVEKHLNYNYTTMGAAPYGHLWRNLRRITTLEFFSTTRLATTAHVRRDEVVLLAKQLMRNCGNCYSTCYKGWSTVDLKLRFSELSTNMISMMMMGKRYYGDDVGDPKAAVVFRDLMREFMLLTKISNIGDFLPFFQWMDFQGMERRMVELMKKMDKFLQDIVDQQRRNFSINRNEVELDGTEKLLMIDTLLLLQEKEPEFYTDQIIKGLIMIMLIAGTESSSSTMEWTMSLLLNHPEAMKKVRSEIDLHVGHNRRLEEQDLRNLNYLQNVINEALRLYSPVPMLIPHQASEDCTVGGYDVPHGTMLLVNAWAIHRDPKVWVSPEKFMPERFEGESGEGYKMIPFGAGRRGCPGVVLANRMIGLVLGTLIQSFEWERINEAEEVDMAATAGFSLCKFKALEAICKPRAAMIHHFL